MKYLLSRSWLFFLSFYAIFAIASSAIGQNFSPVCYTANSIENLDNFLSSERAKERNTLIYFRAEWALANLYKNDEYVPSIAFQKVISGTNCVIADVTRETDSKFLRRFDSDGIPFFVLINTNGIKISTLRHSKEFFEFKSWFKSANILNEVIR